jgi:hypothetical protein
MKTFFTIMIKENDTANMGLLTEKLNDGYTVRDQITVGKSTVITLQKYDCAEKKRSELTELRAGVSLGPEHGYSCVQNTEVPF